MATRSPTPYHPDWGTYAAVTDLPNVLGAPTQKANLQVGDLATVGTTKYVCTLATVGAATWTPFLTQANTGSGVILFEWNGTDLAQFDAAITHQRTGGGGPSGSVAATAVADPLYSSENVIQLAASSLQGGWVLPISAAALALPDMFTVEIVLSRTATVTNAFAGVICFTGTTGTVNGMEIQEGLSSSQGLYQSMVIANLGGGTTQAMSTAVSPTVTGVANVPSTLRSVVQRQSGDNPSSWTTRSTLYGDGGAVFGIPTSRLVANAALTTQWDGLDFTRLGVALVVDTTSASPTVRVHALRVWSGSVF
ncbi:MAG: hypothetical protein HC882_00270 [Acidobacteria bacterium]|nr:hypothetical protein [Acidobacteriota bacterium]